MINITILEGIVVNTWKFGSDQFARLACYRDPGQPVKRLDEARDEPDYVNVRFTNAAQQMPEFPRGTLLRVEGLLQSREYQESLQEFIDKARKTVQGGLGIELTGRQAREITCGRSTVEILARQHVILQPAQPRPERKPDLRVPATVPPVEPEPQTQPARQVRRKAAVGEAPAPEVLTAQAE
jgi:hypothetical protein